MRSYPSLAVIGLATAFLCLAWAEEAREHRRHGSHEHGVAKLRLAQEAGEVLLELESPAVNIVGFEHAPANAADREALERAVRTLKDGERVFRFAAEAECRLTEVRMETPLLAQGGGATHEVRPEPEQGEEQEHDHEHGHEQEPDGVAAHAHGNGSQSHAEAHADIDAAYRFTCAKPDALGQLEVGLFAAFPATLRVQAEYVVVTGQGAGVLTADAPVLRF